MVVAAFVYVRKESGDASLMGSDNLRSQSCGRRNGIFQSNPANGAEAPGRTEPYARFSSGACSRS